jgi:hypothetical protein
MSQRLERSLFGVNRRNVIFVSIALSAVAVAWRRPDAFLLPQFWAEDAIWYPSAYSNGIGSIFSPAAGYLLIFPRLVSVLAVQLPLVAGPALFNLAGLIVEVAPVPFLLSRRFDRLIPSLAVRILLCALYVALPNSSDLDVNLTNTQWHLALLAFLVLAAEPPGSRIEWTVDIVALVLTSLTGPFALLLLPVAGVIAIRHRSRKDLVVLGILAVGAVAQLAVIATIGAPQRHFAPVGWQPLLELRVLAGQVLVGATLGLNQYKVVYDQPYWQGNVWPVVIAVAGLASGLYAAFRGPLVLKLFLLFAGLSFAAVFVGKQNGPDAATVYEIPGLGGRYYFLPMLAWLSVVVWMALTRGAPIRVVGVLLLAATIFVAVPGDWVYPAYVHTGFYKAARSFEAAPSGTRQVFTINPPGWDLTLTKR